MEGDWQLPTESICFDYDFRKEIFSALMMRPFLIVSIFNNLDYGAKFDCAVTLKARSR